MSECKIQRKYSWIKCEREALQNDTDGLCLLHSQKIDKNKEAFYAEIQSKIDAQDYDFQAVVFPIRIDFSHHIFTQNAEFSWATFTQGANFLRAKFNELASFYAATFTKQAFFAAVTFSERADFGGTTFDQQAIFAGSKFKKDTNFTGVTFTQEASFFGAGFFGQAWFVKINHREVGQPQPSIFAGDFRELQLDHGASLLLQDASLATVQFSETEMRSLTFRNVDWHHYHNLAAEFFIKSIPPRWKNWFRGRQAVYDEILLREKSQDACDLFLKHGLKVARQKSKKVRPEDYARVEELYQGLKQNYEKIGDYKRVGDFHYGEMEMHRLASPWRWLPLYWYNLYKFLSGYGERPLWAFILLVGFLFGLTGLAWSWGLGFNPELSSYPNTVSYRDALVFILEKATLQRPDWLIPQNLVSRVLAGLSVLLIPGQGALFILALRNRLGRRR